MHRDAVLLYGAPASGKDTVSDALCQLDARYALFRKLKVGGGRSAGYRWTTAENLTRLRVSGTLVDESARYGNTYAVDATELGRLLASCRTPIVHMGRLHGVANVTRYPAAWLVARLWCPRETAEERLRNRGSTDLADRMRAWDEAAGDGTSVRFSLTVDTSRHTPAESAALIHENL